MNPDLLPLVIFAFAPFFIFFVLFACLKWWESLPGVSTFILTFAISLVGALVVARYAGWPVPDGVREVIFASVGIAGWFQLAAFVYSRYFSRDKVGR